MSYRPPTISLDESKLPKLPRKRLQMSTCAYSRQIIGWRLISYRPAASEPCGGGKR